MRCFIGWLAGLFVTMHVQADDVTSLQYTIQRSGPTIVDVSLSFPSSKDREQLIIPTEYAGSVGAEQGIRNIHIRNEVCDIELTYPRIERKVIVLENCGPSTFLVNYQLVAVSDASNHVMHDARFLPLINEQKYHWINAMALLIPWPRQEEVSVQLTIKPEATDRVYSNLPTAESNEYAFRGNVYDFLLSFLYVGDAQNSTVLKGAGYQVLIEHQIEHPALQPLTDVPKILSFLQQQLGELKQPHSFLLTTLNASDCLESTDGLALPNGVWIQTTGLRNSELFRHLLIHELVHAWLPGQFKAATADNQLAMRWFTEGFTDYLAVLTAKELGLFTQSEFNDYINSTLLTAKYAYFAKLPFDEWAALYHNPPHWLGWHDQLSRVPYWKGLLLALKWDEELRRNSSQLFDVIHQMIAEGPIQLSQDTIAAYFRKNGVRDPVGDIQAYLVRNEGALSTQLRYLNCSLVTLQPNQSFDFGFDFPIEQSITGLRAGSHAYQAGLRSGDMVQTAVYTFGDATKEVTIVTTDGREFRFLPTRRTQEHILQKTAGIPSSDARCTEWTLGE